MTRCSFVSRSSTNFIWCMVYLILRYFELIYYNQCPYSVFSCMFAYVLLSVKDESINDGFGKNVCVCVRHSEWWADPRYCVWFVGSIIIINLLFVRHWEQRIYKGVYNKLVGKKLVGAFFYPCSLSFPVVSCAAHRTGNCHFRVAQKSTSKL